MREIIKFKPKENEKAFFVVRFSSGGEAIQIKKDGTMHVKKLKGKLESIPKASQQLNYYSIADRTAPKSGTSHMERRFVYLVTKKGMRFDYSLTKLRNEMQKVINMNREVLNEKEVRKMFSIWTRLRDEVKELGKELPDTLKHRDGGF